MRRRSTSVVRFPRLLYLPKEWSELLSSRDVRLLAGADGLANLEALELGMAEVEGLVLSGPLVSGPKGFGSGPSLERGPALPYGVGGIERMIFGLRTFEQVEFHKPRHRVEVAITRQPYVFESLLRPFDDTELVHGDKHRGTSWLRAKSSA